MKYHIQFYKRNLKGVLTDALGSDSVFILDGRNNLETMIQDGINRAKQLRFTHPYYEMFEVRKGDLKHSIVLAKYNLKTNKREK